MPRLSRRMCDVDGELLVGPLTGRHRLPTHTVVLHRCAEEAARVNHAVRITVCVELRVHPGGRLRLGRIGRVNLDRSVPLDARGARIAQADDVAHCVISFLLSAVGTWAGPTRAGWPDRWALLSPTAPSGASSRRRAIAFRPRGVIWTRPRLRPTREWVIRPDAASEISAR